MHAQVLIQAIHTRRLQTTVNALQTNGDIFWVLLSFMVFTLVIESVSN